ncbi:CxxH/CxxC protein [Bacillus sp. HMF5848]|uniref:CxxH/CxxC protein n=1 Tax=Bacillus sp. HMF5848 TaxID=2495421 RepID=UPI000F7B064D|nr:CxxH/CxxC protein [Bacillus sp. HMF5848]RSK29165.1 CxxH/CxxC protein [Bacillus sp. HMF5848]
MIYCCNDHVEVAMDTIVDTYEVAPEINKVEQENALLITCEFCKNSAIYVVANPHSDTICG